MRARWAREGADWPNRETSRFVEAGRLRWHVQRAGTGPTILLLHGTGGATHSWRDLLPLLARDHDVIAPDLPGHGFTDTLPAGTVSLPAMTRALGALLTAVEATPALIVGHSAGAAIAARMVIDGRTPAVPIVSLSGALLPFPGMMQPWAAGVAKLLFVNPIVPRLFSWHASTTGMVDRLLGSTGSTIDDCQRGYYARLFATSAHVEGALAMMANWDLAGLERDLPRLASPLTLVAPAQDRFVAPDIATRVASVVPHAGIVPVAGLGHLAHEEDATRIAPLIRAAVTGAGAGDGRSATAPADRPGVPPRAASDTAA